MIEQIIERNYTRGKSTINKWQYAIRSAEDAQNPSRYLLIDIYKDILIDPHLSAQINLRKQKTLYNSLALVDKNGKKNQIASEKLNAFELIQTISHLLDSVYYGHSLIQIDMDRDAIKPTLIPRENVLPNKGILLKSLSDNIGIKYRDTFKGQFIESINFQDLGILNQCVPYILFKRFTTSAWAEFCEIFGMPLRVAKTSTRDGKALAQMEQMMINMGSLAYSVIDHDDEVQFYESKKTDGAIYEQLIKHCNSEISKLINGAVIGEDSQNGSRSKEEVGERLSSYLYLADQRAVTHIINSQLLPILGLDTFKFQFEEEGNLQALWEKTAQAMPHYDVDADFITKTFGIPVKPKTYNPQTKQSLSNNNTDDTPFFA